MDSDDIKPLIAILRTGVYHATSLCHYRRILSAADIRPRSEQPGISVDRPDSSNCWQLNAVSLLDFERPTYAQIYDPIEFLKWPTVLFWHRPAVLIGFRRGTLPGHIIYYDEAKERCGPGGIIPSVEICHEGDIPISKAFQCIIAARSPTVNGQNHYYFEAYPGHHISDEDLDKWKSSQP